jgi:hypothetical protein
MQSFNVTLCSVDENEGIKVGCRGGRVIYYGQGWGGLRSKGELVEYSTIPGST